MNRFALLLLALPTAIFADDPFDCVDPDIVEAFLGNWYQNRPNYSTSIPDDFVKMGLPAHFTLVGSAVHGSSVSVVYKTEENANAALSSVVDVMENEGWR